MLLTIDFQIEIYFNFLKITRNAELFGINIFFSSGPLNCINMLLQNQIGWNKMRWQRINFFIQYNSFIIHFHFSLNIYLGV